MSIAKAPVMPDDAITTRIERGPGGRQAYLDLGDQRIVVRQLTAVSKSDLLDVPNIIQSIGVDGGIFEAEQIQKLFTCAIGLAEKWAEDIGKEWKC